MEDLEQRYLDGARRFLDVPVTVVYVLQPGGERAESFAGRGVSDFFLLRYEEFGRSRDPVLHHVLDRHEATHNRALMSVLRWKSLPVYKEVFGLHGLTNVLQAPLLHDGHIVGTLTFGSSDSDLAFDAHHVAQAEALASITELALHHVRSRELLEREQRQLVAALELCEEAIVVTDLRTGRRRLNSAGRALLACTVEGESLIDQLMVCERPSDEPRTAVAKVDLAEGGCGVVTMSSIQVDEDASLVVSFLKLDNDRRQGLPMALRRSLTPREQEVAELVSLGLRDGEVASRLVISEYTVKQYLKAVYRKTAVRSRVGLTRLACGADLPVEADHGPLDRGHGQQSSVEGLPDGRTLASVALDAEPEL